MRARDFPSCGGRRNGDVDKSRNCSRPARRRDVRSPPSSRPLARSSVVLDGSRETRSAWSVENPAAVCVFTRQAKILVLVSGLTNERFQKSWTLKPPMNRTIRRRTAQPRSDRSQRAEFVHLSPPDLENEPRAPRRALGHGRIVEFLLATRPVMR